MSCCNAKEPIPACPPRMSDGRSFTDYRPRCAINAELMTDLTNQNLAKSSYESRNARFLFGKLREIGMV